MISVFVDDRWQPAEIVGDNCKTLWVELGNGHKIKRHKVKHLMKKYVPETFRMYDVEESEVKLSWWRRLWNWMKGGV